MGDQIYADDFSARLGREFGHELALTFTEFAKIYREAWTGRIFREMAFAIRIKLEKRGS